VSVCHLLHITEQDINLKHKANTPRWYQAHIRVTHRSDFDVNYTLGEFRFNRMIQSEISDVGRPILDVGRPTSNVG
jgi:hypothetical protein